MAAEDHTTLEVAGQEVRLSSPSKVYFPVPGWTKLDVAQYDVTCAEATVRGLYDRPAKRSS
jgi:bifunctional non-homologous end joining protein LigD